MSDEDVTKLVALTLKIVDQPDDQSHVSAWESCVKQLDAQSLVLAASRLTSDESHRPAQIKARREGILSEVERKNSERVVATLEHLDRAATGLTWASVFLATVGTVLAAIQVWQGFHPRS